MTRGSFPHVPVTAGTAAAAAVGLIDSVDTPGPAVTAAAAAVIGIVADLTVPPPVTTTGVAFVIMAVLVSAVVTIGKARCPSVGNGGGGARKLLAFGITVVVAGPSIIEAVAAAVEAGGGGIGTGAVSVGVDCS